MTRSSVRRAGLVLVLSVALAGCGDSDGTSATTTTAPEAPDASASTPQAIVSLSPTATEMLFAIGAGDQVVAVDAFSYHPPEAPVTELSGFTPNVEAIAAYEPDLVIMESAIVQPELEAVGIPVLVQAAVTDLDGVYDQITELGTATGNTDGAADLVTSMRAEIDALLAGVPERDTPLTYFHELDDTFYSVTSSTFIGHVYSLAGLQNIADPADADGASFGYPQLSQEFVLEADPDIIFFADGACCGQSRETIAARPGWDALRAVQDGNVVEIDADISSRWGPRVVDFLRVVVEATAPLPAATS